METETSLDNLLSKPPSSKTPPRWRGLFLRGLFCGRIGGDPPLGVPAALAGASVLVCPALHAAARGLRGGRRRRRPSLRRETQPAGLAAGRSRAWETARGRAGSLPARQQAVPPAVAEVDDEPDQQPDDEPHPVGPTQAVDHRE